MENLPLAIIGVVVFGSLAITFFFSEPPSRLPVEVPCLPLTTDFFRNGRQRYMWPILIGTTGLTIGFIARIATHFSPASMGTYIFMALVSPPEPPSFPLESVY